MGIRYSALAVPAHYVDKAAASLSDFLRSEECLALDAAGESRLDLDKSWGFLQQVFAPDGSPHPAYELVRGDVTHTDRGWIPFTRFLSPDLVRDIAVELSDVDECAVMEGLSRGRNRPDDRYAEDVDYTLHYLDHARRYVQQAAASGCGIIYSIG